MQKIIFSINGYQHFGGTVQVKISGSGRPEKLSNQKMTNRPIAFLYTINHQHPALIQSIQPTSMVVLVFIDHIYTKLNKQ